MTGSASTHNSSSGASFISVSVLSKRRVLAAVAFATVSLAVAFFVQGPVGWAIVLMVMTVVLLVSLWLWWQLQGPHHLYAGTADAGLVFAAVDQSPESMAVVDYEGNLLYANQTFLGRTGYTLDEVIGKPARSISSNGMTEQQRTQMRATVERGEVWRSVMANRRKDGSEIKEGVSIAPLKDDALSITAFVELKQDITELLAARERVSQLLNFDALTLLPNRWALSAKLDEMVQNSEGFPIEPEYWHALMLVDIDNFSKFNAGHGIHSGDALLRAVAQKMQSLLPPNAWLARTTGDEFAVVLRDAAKSRLDARMMVYVLATELQRGLAHQVLATEDLESVSVSFCIGITVFPFSEPARKRDSEDHIYRRATMALAQAKSQGLGQVHAFSEALQENTQRKLAVERGLYEALSHDHLKMYVQKQVDINGEVRAVEVLLRWQPPGQGMVSPGVFIPVAEESPLIVQLGDWVLERAVQLLCHPLLRQNKISVSVNISARQFAQSDFVEKVGSLIGAAKLETGRLTLEVTESMVLGDVDEAIQTMTRLNALGVQCALDDFGTGYSSLAYLHRLPIHEIKIDQSFIHHLDPDAKSGALVQALLMVAKSLQLRVVAEGVEESDQAALLHAWYPAILCQGYLYSKPIPAQEWLNELARQTLLPQSR